jgi:hypothetical protein
MELNMRKLTKEEQDVFLELINEEVQNWIDTLKRAQEDPRMARVIAKPEILRAKLSAVDHFSSFLRKRVRGA